MQNPKPHSIRHRIHKRGVILLAQQPTEQPIKLDTEPAGHAVAHLLGPARSSESRDASAARPVVDNELGGTQQIGSMNGQRLLTSARQAGDGLWPSVG
jgi:hypothetical protein